MISEYQFESYKEINSDVILEIRTLEALCNKHDCTQYQLFLENTLNADRELEFVYLYRRKGKLVSFLLLFFPDLKDIEVYGFTHPDFRRRGLFSSLIKAANGVLNKYDSYSHLFVCDPECTDGIAFLNKQKAVLEETEYMMEMNWSEYDVYIKNYITPEYSIELKPGTMDQLDQISIIAERMYDDEKEKSVEFVRQTILSENRDQLIGLKDGRIVGICTVGREDNMIMINGLAIGKEFQGRGYGRFYLNQILNSVREKYSSPLKLEVSSVNDRAFSLYQSVGFEQKESYGYYRKHD